MNDKTEDDVDTTTDKHVVTLPRHATDGEKITITEAKPTAGQNILVYGCNHVETVAPGEKALFMARAVPNPDHDPTDPTSAPIQMVWDRLS